MTNKQELFDERYRRVIKRHRQLSRGYVTRLDGTGLIKHYPIGQVREAISLKILVLPVIIFIFLKAAIVTILGEEKYAAQVALLQEGSFGAQIGGFLMQMDPLTWPVAKILGTVIG